MHQGPYTLMEIGFIKQCKIETSDNSHSCDKQIQDMATVLGYKKDAIRIKVIKYNGTQQSECRKFSVDPQITSYEVLYSLLAKAFEVGKEFSICYRVVDSYGQESYLPLLSDYELDAAILYASEPCLCLRIDLIDVMNPPLDEDVAECIQPETSLSFMSLTGNKVPLKLQGLIKNQVEKTFNIFKGALSYMEEQSANLATLHYPPRSPLTDAEFRQFLGPVGQIVQSRELRTVIYYGGIEPSLRRVVWKHILNVYPEGMSGKERMEYTKRKAEEYFQLRDIWKELLKKEQMVGDLAYVTGMVRKDVLRTDRHHEFYEGADDNCNVISLFNILTTYALNHPSVSYCQGMSDLASPLLVTMSDEAHAYICFCALMRRLAPNFLLDGIKMTLKFQHLADGLMYFHPSFYEYLKFHQADDLLFCYRWLLLEMKREFAFNDALVMLEVMWSSLPPNPPQYELPLFDKKFEPPTEIPPLSPSPSPRENQYTKVCAIRRQTTSSATSSPFKLNSTLDESPLALRRKNKIEPYSNLNDTKIISTNGIVKSSPGFYPNFVYNSPNSSNSPTPNSVIHPINNKPPAQNYSPMTFNSQNIVQKFTQVTKNNLHKSLEKINLQQEYANHVFNRRGSLKINSTASAASTKIVRNLNEFLNFSKKIHRNMSLTGESVVQFDPKLKEKLNKQNSLDESNRRKDPLTDGIEGKYVKRSQIINRGDHASESQVGVGKDNLSKAMFSVKDNPNVSSDAISVTETSRVEHNHSIPLLSKSFNAKDKISETITEINEHSSDNSPEKNVNTQQNDINKTESSYPTHHLSNNINASSNSNTSAINDKSPNAITCENGDSYEKQIQDIESNLYKRIEAIPGANETPRYESSPEDDDSSEYFPMTSSITQEMKQELENLNRNVLSENTLHVIANDVDEIESGFESNASNTTTSVHNTKFNDEIFIWENPLGLNETDDVKVAVELVEAFSPAPDWNQKLSTSRSANSLHSNKSSNASDNDISTSSSGTTSGADSIHSSDSTNQIKSPPDSGNQVRELSHVINSRHQRIGLPPPNEFGGGNPFLMFLCISVLCQHSERIMSTGMDYNEMAIYFDKMIRKHNVHKVLNEARRRYEKYLCNYRQLSRHQQPPRA